MRRLVALSCLALVACATPRAEKVSFAEVFAPRAPEPEPEPAPAPTLLRRKPRAPAAPAKDLPTARTSPELQASLATFANRARDHRRHERRGSPMPDGQVENWEEVIAALDDFLDRPAAKTSSLDIVRARVTLEAELEEDARAYGDIPAKLAEGVMSRVNLLSVRMAEVRRLQVKTVREVPRFTWPVAPVSITSYFGEREHPIMGELRNHLGLDLAARRGQAVTASAPGVVLSAGWNGSHGYQVEIQHASRIFTRYSHLSRVLVEPGEILERGDVLGLAGDTGLATGVHLHFELWKDGRPMDPLEELHQPAEELVVGESSPEAPQAQPPRRKGRRLSTRP